jgi:ABC-2 type transport system permease protein
MSAPALVLHQFRYDQRVFWRNPAAVFFTVGFPVMFLVIFNLVFGHGDTIQGLGVSVSTYYVPAITSLAVASATFQNLAMSVTIDRENGILKRIRATPMPRWVFIAGRIGNSVVVSVLMLALLATLGRIAYGVEIPWSRMPAVLTTLAIAAPITNLALFPLYFLSGVFIPESEIPDGVLNIAGAFPVRHFFEAFFTAWDPATTGAGFEWGDLAVVAAWGVAGLLITIRTFRWVPRSA